MNKFRADRGIAIVSAAFIAKSQSILVKELEMRTYQKIIVTLPYGYSALVRNFDDVLGLAWIGQNSLSKPHF
jgi:hypothetical protein